jgi:hypothetical protein
MVTKFNVQKKKSIVCCIVDNLDLYTSGWAKEISKNLSDFMIRGFNNNGFDIYIGKNEDDLLRSAAEDNYSHAVMIASGTSFGLSDRIYNAIDNMCTQDFFIAGHILDRHDHSYYKNACYELHHQFYIVNLNEYRELDFPLIGNEEWVSYTQKDPIRSLECLYNNDEVPVWIKPGIEEKTFDVKLHGWNILNQGWLHNKVMIDLGSTIRNNKKYIYYEHDHVFTREVSYLYYNSFFCHNVFAPFNSDSLTNNFNFEGPIDQYVTVGIGLFWIKNLERIGFTDSTKVIFTDINFNCLRFMRKMVDEWDGVDYVSFYQDYAATQPNESWFNVHQHTDAWNTEWKNFQSLFDDWAGTWVKIKQLTYHYELIDYTSVYNFDWIDSGKKTLINLSDLFNHVPFVTTHPLKYRIGCENRLLDKLTKKDPNMLVLLTSRAAEGFFKHNITHEIKEVKNFELTDINELKTPPWHADEWRNAGSRPLGID